MLKALIKKQFAELGSLYFVNKKTGKPRSKKSTVLLIILFVFLAIVSSASFFGMGMLFSSAFIPLNLDWLYFAMMGGIALFVSLIGEVFGTYSMLYNAKDNDALLSMPIPPRYILLSRMSTLYILSVVFTVIVFLPAMIAYWINGGALTALGLIFCILLILFIALASLTLACLLGWVVALVSSRLRGNKAVMTVIISVLLLGLYYVVYFRLNSILQSVVGNAEHIAEVVSKKIPPLYWLGLAATGKPLYMLLFAAGTLVLFALVLVLIAKNFTRLATRNLGERAAKYNSGDVKAASVQRALLGREFKHFTSSAAYMLNCGIGLLMMLALAVFALIKSDMLRGLSGLLAYQLPAIGVLLPAAVAAILMLLASMNAITAPSVSLEGKSIWIVQSLPVEQKLVLRAKQHMHLILNGSVGLVVSVLVCIAFGLGALDALLVTCCALAFIALSSAFGLAVNIKKPMLDWTNETVPIKQGMGTVLAMFGGWAFAVVFAGLAFVLAYCLNCTAAAMRVYMAATCLAMLAGAYFITRWIDTKGAEIFGKL